MDFEGKIVINKGLNKGDLLINSGYKDLSEGQEVAFGKQYCTKSGNQSISNNMKKSFREFAISSWAIDNRVTIFMLSCVIVIAGLVSYDRLPKENFPEIAFPVIYVSTVYPGTFAGDIEKPSQ